TKKAQRKTYKAAYKKGMDHLLPFPVSRHGRFRETSRVASPFIPAFLLPRSNPSSSPSSRHPGRSLHHLESPFPRVGWRPPPRATNMQMGTHSENTGNLLSRA